MKPREASLGWMATSAGSVGRRDSGVWDMEQLAVVFPKLQNGLVSACDQIRQLYCASSFMDGAEDQANWGKIKKWSARAPPE